MKSAINDSCKTEKGVKLIGFCDVIQICVIE